MSTGARTVPEQDWTRYLDDLEDAVTQVALAVADERDPLVPAGLVAPAGPVPAALRERATRSAAALAAVGDVLAGARDRVAHEISLVARHSASRRPSSTGSLGTFLDHSA